MHFKVSELILKEKILLLHKAVLIQDFLPKYSLGESLRHKYPLVVIVYMWNKNRSSRGSGKLSRVLCHLDILD